MQNEQAFWEQYWSKLIYTNNMPVGILHVRKIGQPKPKSNLLVTFHTEPARKLSHWNATKHDEEKSGKLKSELTLRAPHPLAGLGPGNGPRVK